MTILTFPCGAELVSIEPIAVSPPGHRVRIAVFDSDGDIKAPIHDGGIPARCLAGCPKEKRGRKFVKCWPSDPNKKPPPWR